MAEGNKPLKKFRCGVVSATMWENKGKDDKVFKSVVLSKAYKDAEDNWKNTDSLSVSDLPKAQLVLAEAFKYASLTNEGD